MKRLIGPGTSHYHVVSRVVDRAFKFDVTEKNRFRDMMWRVAEFSGVKVLTYTVMSNHFHLLIQVPDIDDAEISDEELLRRVCLLYNERVADVLKEDLASCLADGDEKGWERLRRAYLYRMHNLSEFMKTFKQRFSVWYNRTHNRRGTLWEERFRSVLVQAPDYGGDPLFGRRALLTIAAYIELNAVRAGLVDDPKDYRWCGLGEAVAGIRRGRHGICFLYDRDLQDWKQVSTEYRSYVYAKGGEGAFDRKRLRQVFESGGVLSHEELLRCRVRYFADGVVVGCRAFVEDIYAQRRGVFGAKRKSGARKMQGGDWLGLCSIRDLKKDVIG